MLGLVMLGVPRRIAKTAGRPEALGLWTDGRRIDTGMAKWWLLLYILVDDDGAKPRNGDLPFGNRHVA
jgi:hypothetical protein